MPVVHLRYEDRSLRLFKSAIDPDLGTRTILVEDQWDYVEMWLKRNGLNNALFFWRQAEDFAKASKSLPHTSSPLTRYYSAMNAVKALLVAKGIAFKPYHGLAGANVTGAALLADERVTLMANTQIAPALCRYMGEAVTRTTYSLEDMLYNLPYIHRAFTVTFPGKVELFLPISDPRFLRILHRRQGAARLSSGAIQAETLAPYLAAFHGKFQVAIRQRRTIFEDRSTYGEVFPDQITASHALLVRALGKAIDDYKIELFAKEQAGTLNDAEKVVYDFLQFSTSKLFLTAAVGNLASQILGRPVPDLFNWKVADAHFKQDWSPLVERWKVLVESLAPLFISLIDGEHKDAVRSSEVLEKLAKRAALQIQSLKTQYDAVFDAVRAVSA